MYHTYFFYLFLFNNNQKKFKKHFTNIKLPQFNYHNVPISRSVQVKSILFCKNFLIKIDIVICTIFSNGYNILFLDDTYNYNYLPFTNKQIAAKGNKKYLLKALKYFNVKCCIHFNVKKQKSYSVEVIKTGILNISSGGTKNSPMDFYFNLPNTELHNYMLYVHILSIYLRFNK